MGTRKDFSKPQANYGTSDESNEGFFGFSDDSDETHDMTGPGPWISPSRTEPIKDMECNRPTIKPVVGWLVCKAGPSIGQDYRLHSNFNYVGRNATLDVYIKDDPKVSREGMIKIDYDPVSKTYAIAPCEHARNLSYLNGKPIRGDRELEPYDVIKVGDTELIFVPFCSSQFSWNAEIINSTYREKKNLGRDDMSNQETMDVY